jgi:hypothetical protein
MHICYLDDSGDVAHRAFSVLAIPVDEWHKSFKQIKSFRSELKRREGIYTSKEFHATEFVSGRGKIAPIVIPKGARCRVFNETLDEITRLPGVSLFNAFARKGDELNLFERLLNRVNRTMQAWDSKTILISDEGKDYNGLVRKMGVYNPIPSMFMGGATRNILLDKIVDEILYKRSEDSHFIQMADFCAYSLLRSEVPLPSKDRYGLNLSFDRLSAICQSQCFAKDPRKLGIIRYP